MTSSITTNVPASLLDAADPLAHFRARFLEPKNGEVRAYLDGNSLGRPLAVTPDQLKDFVDTQWGERLIRSWDDSWMQEPVRLGDRLAHVVLGSAPGQTIVADSTSVMLYKLLRAAMGGRPGRSEIVLDRENFPTDRFIVEGIAAELGATIQWIQPHSKGGVRPEDLKDVVGSRTAIVLLSHVAYRSGFLADAAAITELVHEAGALVLWDLCHSAGAVPIQLDAWGVDLAVGCTYKYLNGGPGAPAFGYVSADLQQQLQQPIWGWMGAHDPFGMSRDYRPADDVRRFLTGTPAILAMQPLKDMIELIAEAGIDAVRDKSVLLTERAIALTDELLLPLGVELTSPRDPAARGSHVTIDHPCFREVVATLWQRGIIPDFRPPHGLRIGLSPLSTSFTELQVGIEAIRDCLREIL
jgi:kynureninase